MPDVHLTRYREVHEALCHPGLRQSLYDAGEVIMKDVLLTLHGSQHKARRHLELRLFRRNYAHFYETSIFPKTLAGILTPLVEKGEADLVDFGYRVTMNLTADFAGIDRPEDAASETDKLLAIVKKFSEGATLVHTDRDPVAVVREVESAREAFNAFLKPSWQRRARLIQQFESGEIPEDELPRDVLTVLLRNQDNVNLPDDVIEREICFYLQAGSHSTANAMVHAVHEIFKWHDDPQRLLRDPLTLQRCVHESLRLHPASPVAWRTPLTPMTIANREVTPDDLLILDIAAANRDTLVFGPHAHDFMPDRKISTPRVEPFGLTFGTGVHMCTGRDLDGGVSQRQNTDPETHQYGIVCKLIENLLANNLRADDQKQPEQDTTTTRVNWGYYPVKLG